ncbi:MAG: FAD/NAD(P)-binding protein [Candidatus Zixiibacteriota bacterium]
MRPLSYRVRQYRAETEDTFSIMIEPEDGQSIGRFAPGQFNMLYAHGAGESAISISSDPRHPRELWHTIRRAGIVTNAIGRLRKGDWIGVRGPYGASWPMHEAQGKDVLIVAGGIGLAPLRPALLQILAERHKYEGIFLLYGARTPDDLLFRRQLEQWRGRLDAHVGVTVDRAPTTWRGEVGVVTTLIPLAPFNPLRTVAMICGPELMMRFTARDLIDDGVPMDQIYISMERNMKCGIGFCGHCQWGRYFVCKDGPVFRYDSVQALMGIREL